MSPINAQPVHIVIDSETDQLYVRCAGASDDPDTVYLVPAETFTRWVQVLIAMDELKSEVVKDWWAKRQDLIDARQAAWHSEHADRKYCVACGGKPTAVAVPGAI